MDRNSDQVQAWGKWWTGKFDSVAAGAMDAALELDPPAMHELEIDDWPEDVKCMADLMDFLRLGQDLGAYRGVTVGPSTVSGGAVSLLADVPRFDLDDTIGWDELGDEEDARAEDAMLFAR